MSRSKEPRMLLFPPTPLKAKEGFDWSRVDWGGPHDRRTRKCNYCAKPFPDEDTADDEQFDFMPLILWKDDGSCAEFCEECQATWFGVRKV